MFPLVVLEMAYVYTTTLSVTWGPLLCQRAEARYLEFLTVGCASLRLGSIIYSNRCLIAAGSLVLSSPADGSRRRDAGR